MPSRNELNNTLHIEMYEAKAVLADNTTLKGAAIDTQGYDAIDITTHIGIWGDTVSGGLIEVCLQESDDTVDGNFTAVAATDLSGDTIAPASTVSGAAATTGLASVSSTATDQKLKKTAYLGSKRYVRVVFNCQKTLATGTPISVLMHGRRAHYLPVA